ncbi:hypothetical protein ABZX62_00220 [Streptomyces flavidovirens]|uniref:hypothetical protein n=1 Tax=Streptomyces flavidovirens TaxID=67298 RepID=UPI0033ACAA98
MRRTSTAITACLLFALTACGGTDVKADPAACKKAMTKAFDDAMAAGDKAEESKRPAACDGLDDKTLKRLAGEVTTEWMKGDKAADELEEDLDEMQQDLDDAVDEYATETP